MSNVAHSPLGQKANKQTTQYKIRTYLHDKSDSIRDYFKYTREEQRARTARNHELRSELREAGLSELDMLRPETFHLNEVLFSDERVVAALCGRTPDSGMTLVIVTDVRIVAINRIPAFDDVEEYGFSTISGIGVQENRWSVTVTLLSSMGNIVMRSVNIDAAQRFIDTIEHIAVENLELSEPILDAD